RPVPPWQFRTRADLLQNYLCHLNRKRRVPFNMKAEHTIDKPAQAGRATQIAAMIITGLVAFIWMYFGRLYLIGDPGEWRIANQQLGYPLYIIPLIGVTHILGGVGLLIPNVPRLTEWVYAGLTINLVLTFYSQLNSGGSIWDKFDPILVMAFVFASYVLRRCMRANRWSI
ncbi:MAG: DoxX family protein, partial [Edaphobacter sp.]